MSINSEKIRQNADLINPISVCPFGEPIAKCLFHPYYEMNNEREQIMQIDVFHRKNWMNFVSFTVLVWKGSGTESENLKKKYASTRRDL